MKKMIVVFTLLVSVNTLLSASVIKENEELDQLLEAGRFEAAGEKIEFVKKPYDKSYWQSRISFYTGKYRDAYGEIDSALGFKESKPWWESLSNYYYYISQLEECFQQFDSDHFIFRAKGKDVILARYALDTLEKAYAQIGLELNYYPKAKVLVEVFDSKNEFS